MRGATAYISLECSFCIISIHAPHARSDSTSRSEITAASAFQSTLLMRGATPCFYGLKSNRRRFQSTLLMRGATRMRRCQMARRCYFNPRSSCEERLEQAALQSDSHISIHAPHARSDAVMSSSTSRYSNFNPRSSCEERRARGNLHH